MKRKFVVAVAALCAAVVAASAATAGSYRQVWTPAGEISLCPVQPDGQMRVYPVGGGRFVQWEATLPLMLGDVVRGIVLPATGNREPGRMVVRLDGVRIAEFKAPPYRFQFPVARQFFPPLDPGLLHQLEAWFEQAGRRPLAAAPTLKFYVSEPMTLVVPVATLAPAPVGPTGAAPAFVPRGVATAIQAAAPESVPAVTDTAATPPTVAPAPPKFGEPPTGKRPELEPKARAEAMERHGRRMEAAAGFARLAVEMTAAGRPVNGRVRITSVPDGKYVDVDVEGKKTVRLLPGRYSVAVHGRGGEWLQPRGQRLSFEVGSEMVALRFIKAANAAQEEVVR